MSDSWDLREEEKKKWRVFGAIVVSAVFLSVLAILVDTRTIPILDYVPAWLLSNVERATTVLSTLAGTLFAVTTFTFTAMLTVVSIYTSNASPRVVENFFLNKSSLRTLSIFLGGFVYSLSTLVFMRDLPPETMVISGMVAWMYAIAAVVYFIVFIYQTSNYMQLEKTVSKMYWEAEEVFDNYIASFNEDETLEHLPDFSTLYKYTAKAEAAAYIDFFRFEQLIEFCEKYQGVCVCQVKMGSFVNKGHPIATFYSNTKLDKDKQFNQLVNKSMSYNTEPSTTLDPYYSSMKLTDIALRAVSPAINDPNTAIHVLHYKSVLGTKFAALPGRFAVLGNAEEDQTTHDTLLKYKGCVIYEYNDFSAILHKNYRQLIHYMKDDISCVETLFDVFFVLACAAQEDKLGPIKEYSQYLYDLTYDQFSSSLDRQIIEEKHQAVLHAGTPDN